jgi:hypothetical protein
MCLFGGVEDRGGRHVVLLCGATVMCRAQRMLSKGKQLHSHLSAFPRIPSEASSPSWPVKSNVHVSSGKMQPGTVRTRSHVQEVGQPQK